VGGLNSNNSVDVLDSTICDYCIADIDPRLLALLAFGEGAISLNIKKQIRISGEKR